MPAAFHAQTHKNTHQFLKQHMGRSNALNRVARSKRGFGAAQTELKTKTQSGTSCSTTGEIKKKKEAARM
uniref:60S ribosomal protein L29 n=1 Tax=Oryza brachyantha TaxID=4533 RepID=J3N727_ORYBR